MTASTHEKYLLKSGLEGSDFARRGEVLLRQGRAKDADARLRRRRDAGEVKRAASAYSGQEKEGVHEIATSNLSVVDVEIAINASGIPGIKRKLPRMDLANFETTANGVDLVFWEAKMFSNPELENRDIVGQIEDYQKVIDAHKTEIDDSYRWVAKNLAKMAEWSNGRRSAVGAISAVAEGGQLNVNSANIGLLVYNFTEDQRDRKDEGGKRLNDRVIKSLAQVGVGPKRIRFKGTPKGLTI